MKSQAASQATKSSYDSDEWVDLAHIRLTNNVRNIEFRSDSIWQTCGIYAITSYRLRASARFDLNAKVHFHHEGTHHTTTLPFRIIRVDLEALTADLIKFASALSISKGHLFHSGLAVQFVAGKFFIKTDTFSGVSLEANIRLRSTQQVLQVI